MPEISSEQIVIKRNELELNIKNLEGYFTFGRRIVWLDSETFKKESLSYLALRALSILTLVIPCFYAYQLFRAKKELKKLPNELQNVKQLPASFNVLPKQILQLILSNCGFIDKINLSACNKTLKLIFESDPRMKKMTRIVNAISTYGKSIPCPYPKTCQIDRVNQRIIIGQEIDHAKKGLDSLIIFDEDFCLNQKMTFFKDIFTHSIEQIIPAKNGNIFAISEFPENMVAYWSVKTGMAYPLKKYDTYIKACYCAETEKLYIGTDSVIDVFKENGLKKPVLIQTINTGNVFPIIDIKIAGKNIYLIVINTVTYGNDVLIYDLENNQFIAIQQSFQKVLHIDTSNNLVIGYIDEKKLLIWDVKQNNIYQEQSLDQINAYKISSYYDEQKKILIFSTEHGSTLADFLDNCFMWDIEKNVFNQLKLESKYFNDPHDAFVFAKLDYDAESEVLMITFGNYSYFWDLKTGMSLSQHKSAEVFRPQFGVFWDKVNSVFISLLNKEIYVNSP